MTKQLILELGKVTCRRHLRHFVPGRRKAILRELEEDNEKAEEPLTETPPGQVSDNVSLQN